MTVPCFEIYTTYSALSLHFKGGYDAAKYRFKSKAFTMANFDKWKGRAAARNLQGSFKTSSECIIFFASNLVRNPKFWISDSFKANAREQFITANAWNDHYYFKKFANTSCVAVIENDLEDLFDDFYEGKENFLDLEFAGYAKLYGHPVYNRLIQSASLRYQAEEFDEQIGRYASILGYLNSSEVNQARSEFLKTLAFPS